MHSLVTADTMTSTGTSDPKRMTAKLEASGAWGREIGMWDRKGWQRHSLSVLGRHPGGTASPTSRVAVSPSRRLLLPGVSRPWCCPPASGHTTPMNLLRGCLSSWSPRVQGIMSVRASQRVAQASLPSVTWERVKNADLWGPLQTYWIQISGDESRNEQGRQPCSTPILGTRIKLENRWPRGSQELQFGMENTNKRYWRLRGTQGRGITAG